MSMTEIIDPKDPLLRNVNILINFKYIILQQLCVMIFQVIEINKNKKYKFYFTFSSTVTISEIILIVILFLI